MLWNGWGCSNRNGEMQTAKQRALHCGAPALPHSTCTSASTSSCRCPHLPQGVGLKHLTGDVKSMLSRITETDQVGDVQAFNGGGCTWLLSCDVRHASHRAAAAPNTIFKK